MMKKKALLTVAAAAALMMSNPLVNQVDAASNIPTVKERVYVYQTTDLNQINLMIERYFASLGKSVPQTIVQEPVQTETVETVPTKETSQAVPTQPVQQQPTAEVQPNVTETPGALSAYEQKVVELTNQERAKNGLPALQVDLTLSKMAHEKSRDMSANGYFSHTSPTYGSPFDMMKKYGISYRYAGENIAMGQRTPEEVVKAWMNSEGHRKNILSPNFNTIGVGYVAQGNYWTQEFIGR
jgi:uncharacterized YkwD family protein